MGARHESTSRFRRPIEILQPERDLSGTSVAILATDGFEESELLEPLGALRKPVAAICHGPWLIAEANAAR